MQLRKHRLDSVRAGFTLMEVMVVMAIIVILAGIGGVMYMRYLEDARRDRARIDVQMLTGAVQNYSVKYGDYPTSLASLLQPPDGARPYIEQTILIDPWGREYHYQYPGQRNAASGKPDIWSDGPTVADAGGVIGNW